MTYSKYEKQNQLKAYYEIETKCLTEYTIDTLEVCTRLSLDHGNTKELISKYREDFEEFGLIDPFETEQLFAGRRTKYYSLNYDQFCFLLTLVRNNPDTVAAKKELIKRYKQARLEVAELKEYLRDKRQALEVAAARKELAELYSVDF